MLRLVDDSTTAQQPRKRKAYGLTADMHLAYFGGRFALVHTPGTGGIILISEADANRYLSTLIELHALREVARRGGIFAYCPQQVAQEIRIATWVQAMQHELGVDVPRPDVAPLAACAPVIKLTIEE